MKHINKIIDSLIVHPSYDEHKELILENCIINELSLSNSQSNIEKVEIRFCIINDLMALGGRFEKGLVLSGCIINDHATFEAGGHNKGNTEFRIENNVFRCYVDFFDAHYEGPFIFKQNILLKGSNLLGNKGLSWETLFQHPPQIEDNIGNLYIRR